MEAAVSTNTTTEPLSIVEQLKSYADSNKISISVLAKEIGLGRSTISKYVNGAYGSDKPMLTKESRSFFPNIQVILLTFQPPQRQKPHRSRASTKAAMQRPCLVYAKAARSMLLWVS